MSWEDVERRRIMRQRQRIDRYGYRQLEEKDKLDCDIELMAL